MSFSILSSVLACFVHRVLLRVNRVVLQTPTAEEIVSRRGENSLKMSLLFRDMALPVVAGTT